MSKFDSDYYLKFRPYYPTAAFHQFEKNLKARKFAEPFKVADLGCGTGHSILSLFRTGIHVQVTGIDPDPRMLEQAKILTKKSQDLIELHIGTGEHTGLNDSAFDAVIIGSAFHWMTPDWTRDELARILKPQGLIRIMEYQFPKASVHSTLNEWIRRQFNLFWKAPQQKPRGSFMDLVRGFHSDARFAYLGSGTPPMTLSLTAKDLLGLLWSQSRVLCYLETLSKEQQVIHYHEVAHALESQFTEQHMEFNFKLQWIEFERSSAIQSRNISGGSQATNSRNTSKETFLSSP